MTRYTMPERSQGKPYAPRAAARLAEKDVHRWVFAHSMDPAVMDRHGTVRSGSIVLYGRNPFTVGLVRVLTTLKKATLELCDRLSNPLIEVDAVVHKNLPLDCVCDWHSLHTRVAYAK